MWLNTCLTFNPNADDKKDHRDFWQPVIDFYFSQLKERTVIVLLGAEVQRMKTPINFIRVCAKHPSPMANPGYFDLRKMINDALGYEFDWD